ncbi:DUF983 domain-containing protein [Pseudemcibacter aquimaris]|uniref:DUF983 domain-containing protein n=1 Tax=Pseudemcibacter aquimaris TaxID=2857064 RepID=UPI00201261ED|nr:DUF983 domain-containing protein [Pseudemcibacter aquimaris]MCC3861915.1 DUF983 domain-containing protein [Pseudemcibacter aquimaris]WDU58667.1 DUF983 domain-containing protein [Pseudemcibacter aquimaris]
MIAVDTQSYSRDSYSTMTAILRGFRRTCPHCGKGSFFTGYLKVGDCKSCNAPLAEIRADDMPPYLTIFIVGHIIIPALVLVEAAYAPPMWMQTVGWSALTLGLTLGFLPYIKGAVVGLMWHLKMKGDEQR